MCSFKLIQVGLLHRNSSAFAKKQTHVAQGWQHQLINCHMFDHHVYVQSTGNSPKVLVKNSMDGRKRSVIKGFINTYTLKRSMFYISWIYFIFCFLKFWVGTEILFFLPMTGMQVWMKFPCLEMLTFIFIY